jgi:Outer membrane protein beta-barrel domain
MKNQFIITLLCLSLFGTIATAQTKKPTTTTKKPSTTVKSTAPKTTTSKTTTTKTTTTVPTTGTTTTTAPVIVEEKKTTTTTTTSSPTQDNSSSTNPSSTTIQQSSGPSKGGKKPAEAKPEKVKEPKPERVREPKPERVREPRPEKVRNPSSDEGIRFGIRAEANQFVSFEGGGQPDFSPGVNAGLIVNIPISESVAIQPEVLYSMTNIKASEGADYDKTTLGSILVPVTFNIKLGQGPTKFMINPGGYADYLLSLSKEESIGGAKSSGSLDLTGADRFGYGAVLGLGVKLNSGLMIETRAFYDLKTSNNKSILATFGIGYMF